MNNPIEDGQIHILSDKYAYIIKKIEPNLESMAKAQEEMLKKYCEYLVDSDRDKVIQILLEKFSQNGILGNTPEDYQFSYRPPHIVGSLSQYGSFSMKF